MASLYEMKTNTLEGQEADLSAYEGKVSLVVNVASACGLTPQYSGLESMQRELSPRGFTVLGFPCNQFGAQEPGAPAEIREFCTSKFSVSFPLFEKVDVKGDNQHPVYQFLTADSDVPDWNFTKYLVGKNGQLIKRYAPTTAPDDATLLADIDEALKA
ncbi:MAG: glutathione peroxidase [Planctomycetes bacterium]|nr:glutathione peroxidase [Planctomycetota bacterium]